VRRRLKFAAVVLGVGLVCSAGLARAGDDDEDDDRTFEERIIDNLITGLGAKSMESPGIEYRERSPLVVPPRLDLPQPTSAEGAKVAPNWPKDPDEKRRKEIAAARKKSGGRAVDPSVAARLLTPKELDAGRIPASREKIDPVQPGVNPNQPTLSPSQLGFSGGLFGLLKGGSSSEQKPFTGEPTRKSLVEPPAGYQTPSPNYAYGSGTDDSKRTYFDVRSGKEKEQ